jgi:Ca2+-binding EF-hand superfamily protein
MHEAES